MILRKPPRVKSPCVNVCVMDEASGYCRGCKRSLEEIAGWAGSSDRQRQAVLDALDARDVPLITPPSAYEPQR
jgi:predicted Fe-S protein YdhL (DUF1289 family)